MPTRAQIVWSVIGLICLLIFLGVIPGEYSICERNPYTDHESCISYQALPFLLFKIGRFIDAAGVAVTAIFTVVLAVSTILLWISTREAARGAERSANIAEQALVSLERPFVFVKEIDLFTERGTGPMGAYGQPLPGTITTYRISAILENSGQTPAVRAVYNFNCGLVAPDRIQTFDFPDQGPNSQGIIGPKTTLQTASHTISAAAIGEIVRNVDRWFIWGWIDYDDIFEETERHRTEFCFEVSARRLPDGQNFVGFPMHRRFNATDADCLRKPAPYAASA